MELASLIISCISLVLVIILLILYVRPKSNNVQINISIPIEWKTELENLARIYSVEEGETITFLDLMRRGIQEKYQLGEQENE